MNQGEDSRRKRWRPCVSCPHPRHTAAAPYACRNARCPDSLCQVLYYRQPRLWGVHVYPLPGTLEDKTCHGRAPGGHAVYRNVPSSPRVPATLQRETHKKPRKTPGKARNGGAVCTLSVQKLPGDAPPRAKMANRVPRMPAGMIPANAVRSMPAVGIGVPSVTPGTRRSRPRTSRVRALPTTGRTARDPVSAAGRIRRGTTGRPRLVRIAGGAAAPV